MMRVAGGYELDPTSLADIVLFVDTIRAPAARTWDELIRAYVELRIPVTSVDHANRIVGGSTVPLKTVGAKPPSAWLDCGRGTGVGEYADINEVTFSMASAVVVLDSVSSTVQSFVRATAKARDVSAAAVKCQSLNTLEMRVGEVIRRRMGPTN